MNRCGGKANLKAIEIGKEITIPVIDGPVGFIGNDQVEKPHVKGLKNFHHGRIGGQVDTLVSVLGCTGRDNGQWRVRHVLIKCVSGLFSEFTPVA
jgi:hypothetical protein